jgi:hypothetical protein
MISSRLSAIEPLFALRLLLFLLLPFFLLLFLLRRLRLLRWLLRSRRWFRGSRFFRSRFRGRRRSCALRRSRGLGRRRRRALLRTLGWRSSLRARSRRRWSPVRRRLSRFRLSWLRTTTRLSHCRTITRLCRRGLARLRGRTTWLCRSSRSRPRARSRLIARPIHRLIGGHCRLARPRGIRRRMSHVRRRRFPHWRHLHHGARSRRSRWTQRLRFASR